MYKSTMHRVIRIVLLFISALVFAGGTAPGQQPSALPAKPSPAPTPIRLASLPFELQSAATSSSGDRHECGEDSVERGRNRRQSLEPDK